MRATGVTHTKQKLTAWQTVWYDTNTLQLWKWCVEKGNSDILGTVGDSQRPESSGS